MVRTKSGTCTLISNRSSLSDHDHVGAERAVLLVNVAEDASRILFRGVDPPVLDARGVDATSSMRRVSCEKRLWEIGEALSGF